jgi:hypothetical protein
MPKTAKTKTGPKTAKPKTGPITPHEMIEFISMALISLTTPQGLVYSPQTKLAKIHDIAVSICGYSKTLAKFSERVLPKSMAITKKTSWLTTSN